MINTANTVKLEAPGFLIHSLDLVPAGALPTKVKVASWISIECGIWAEFEGATEMYKLGANTNTIVAVISKRGLLSWRGGAVQIPAGVWKIAVRE